MTTIEPMPAAKKTTKTAAAPDAEVVTAADVDIPDPSVDDEPPGALGDRFAAAVRAVGDGASGQRIEQILAG